MGIRHLYFRTSRRTEDKKFKTHLKIQEDIDSKEKIKEKTTILIKLNHKMATLKVDSRKQIADSKS